jgi:hypothetical protein
MGMKRAGNEQESGVLNTPALSGMKRTEMYKLPGITYEVVLYGSVTYGSVTYGDVTYGKYHTIPLRITKNLQKLMLSNAGVSPSIKTNCIIIFGVVIAKTKQTGNVR